MAQELGTVLEASIVEQMRSSYIDYAMSVIVARALPDVRDGLKPVQRRILYGMREGGHTPDRPYVKAARVVGNVMGHYHPHGDSAIYDAMVKLAQDFSTRYPLVDGHGNFGSIDGDPPAAMRYTEVRMTRAAMELLRDIDRETVDLIPNFDEKELEPAVLPARLPNLLVNGSSGIAVGMATNIPPHNLREIVSAIDLLLDQPDVPDEELLARVPGPDFPTGGLMIGREGIRQAYLTGRGTLILRAVSRIEADGGRARIVITELPYQVNKARLVERIAGLVKERRIEGIADLRDESDRQGLRIVVELRRDAVPRRVQALLYRLTPMQQSFGVILLALVQGRPKVLSLRQALIHYINHQREVIRRRTEHDLKEAKARDHIVQGLLIALDHLDEVIALIRSSSDPAAAREALMAQLTLSRIQADAILDLRLQRLTALERAKVEQEHQELMQRIAEYEAILADENRVREIVRKELADVAERFGDDRRTRIVNMSLDDQAAEADMLVPDEEDVVTLTHFGYIKRLPLATYRPQRRGGRGITGAKARQEDFVERLFVTTTRHHLLVFTDRGRVYQLPVYAVPEASRNARGTALVNLLELGNGEAVTAVIPLRDEGESDLVLVTLRGVVKRLALTELAHIRRTGIMSLTLDEGDRLIGVHVSSADEEEVLIATRAGQLVRFRAAEVRRMGRTARGVTGVRLRSDDSVVASAAGIKGGEALTITAFGMGLRSPIREFRRTARGSQGVRAIQLNPGDHVAGLVVIGETEDLVLITREGIVIRQPLGEAPIHHRGGRGVHVMRVTEGDEIVAVALAPERDEDESES